mgnify:CR=1 FL=1
MWGAKVKQPCNMPHDMLEELVKKTTKILSGVNAGELQEKGPEIVKQIKVDADAKWGGNWHVIVGKNFGCHATHRSRHFVFFYVSDVATMIFKT